MEIPTQNSESNISCQELSRPVYKVSLQQSIHDINQLITLIERVFVDGINLASREIFEKAAASGEIIDFHDIMLRFTMDSFAEYVQELPVFHVY